MKKLFVFLLVFDFVYFEIKPVLAAPRARPEPTVSNLSIETNENTPVDVSLSVSSWGLKLTYTFEIVTSPSNGTAIIGGNLLTYTPNGDFYGNDELTYLARDSRGRTTAPGTISITVNQVNSAPTANAQDVATDEDMPVDIILTGTDPELQPLTFSLVTQPSRGTVSCNGSDCLYTPTANLHGTDSFLFQVSDGVNDSATAKVSLTINAVNDSPTANSESSSTDEDRSKTITLSGIDIDGDTLGFTISSNPSHGTVTLSGNQASYTPEENFNGGDSFDFKADDGTVFSEPATVSLTVNPVNDTPTAAYQDATTNEDTPVNITLQGSDIEEESLTYEIVTNPSRGTLSGSGQNLIYNPTANLNGTDSFLFRVNDGTDNSPTAQVSITINAVNDPPTANGQSVSLNEDQSKTMTLSGSDIEGSALSYSISSAPSHGTSVISGNQLTYTPVSNYNGNDQLTITASDGSASSEPAALSLTITAVNDAPVTTNPQDVETNQGVPVTFDLLVSDVDQDPLTISILRQPAHGTVVLSGINATYTPTDPDYFGQDLIRYRASDGSAISEATVNMTIQEVKSSGEGADPDPLDWNIYELAGTDISTPLTNGSAVAIGLSDGARTIFFTYTDIGGELILGKLTPDGVMTPITIVNGGVSPGAISADGENIIVAYQADTSSEHLQKVYVSSDGGESGKHLILGDKGVGASVPATCAWQEGSDVKGLVAWVAPPSDADRGPLYIAEITDGTAGPAIQIGVDSAYSASSLFCSPDGKFLAVRYQPDDGSEITTHFAEIDMASLSSLSLREVLKGADPSLCASGDTIGIASHRGATVNFARSTDRGATWKTAALDPSARFGHWTCDGDNGLALYGDWPTTELAMTHDDATRALGAQISYNGGETFYLEYPAGTDGYQGPASGDMDSEGIAIVLKDLDREVIRVITAYTGPTVPFVLSLHMEPHGSRVCDAVNLPEVRCVTDEDFAHNRQKMGEMIEVLNQYGLKATFEASPQWLTRLSETAEGQAVIQSAIDGGHEIALHHHGFDHNDWDGFSDNPLAYTQPHHVYSSLTSQPMSAYMEIVQTFETENNIRMKTMEGTQLEFDWQGWEFKTADGDEKDGWPLDDPNGVCPTGNPSWTQVVLPSISFEDLSLPAWGLTHTNFMGFTPECQRVKADNIQAYFDEVDLDILQPTDAVNLVFHVEDYARDELTPEFDAFFEIVSGYSFIKGMTVSDYMCERVGECRE